MGLKELVVGAVIYVSAPLYGQAAEIPSFKGCAFPSERSVNKIKITQAEDLAEVDAGTVYMLYYKYNNEEMGRLNTLINLYVQNVTNFTLYHTEKVKECEEPGKIYSKKTKIDCALEEKCQVIEPIVKELYEENNSHFGSNDRFLITKSLLKFFIGRVIERFKEPVDIGQKFDEADQNAQQAQNLRKCENGNCSKCKNRVNRICSN